MTQASPKPPRSPEASMPRPSVCAATTEPSLARVWPVHAVGLVHVFAAADVDESKLMRQLAELLRRYGVTDVTVQVSRDEHTASTCVRDDSR